MALTTISVSEFKKLASTDEVRIIRNGKTDKLFAAAGNGICYKAQGTLDINKPISFLYDPDEGGIEDGCFVNPSEANLLITL